MSESKKLELPWVAIPGVKRPNFEFAKIKLSIPTRVPNSLIYSLIYFIVLYIYVGGVYDLVEDPLAFGGNPDGSPALIWRSQDRQFLLEGIVAGVLMLLGSFGLYLFAQATNDPHDTNRATMYQGVGVLLVTFSLYILQSMYKCKIEPGACS